MNKEKKSKSFSNKEHQLLKIKLTKMANNFFKPKCEHFINNMRSMNFKILESSIGKKSLEKEIKESQQFRFGKTKDYFVHFTDLSKFQTEFPPFIKKFENKFTKEQISIIKKNKDYFFQNPILKENISVFGQLSLYQILNNEEKEEDEYKEKIFHNLNYFNNKRKTMLLGLNLPSILKKKMDKINKNEIRSSMVQIKMKEKKKLTYNLNNLPNYILQQNKIERITKEIRKGFNRLKKKEEKLKKLEEKKINELINLGKDFEIKKYLLKEYNNSSEAPESNLLKNNDNKKYINTSSNSNKKSKVLINLKKNILSKNELSLNIPTKNSKKREYEDVVWINNINSKIKNIYTSTNESQ